MQEELLNYNEIIAYFTEETITERFKYLYGRRWLASHCHGNP